MIYGDIESTGNVTGIYMGLPVYINMLTKVPDKIGQGTWDRIVSSTNLNCGGFRNTSAAADGDNFTVNFAVPNGTYRIDFNATKSTNMGIIDVQVDHNMSTGVWNHLTYIRGWGGVANRFAATVNGTAVGYTDSTFTCPDYSGVLQIGADVGHLDGYLPAQIDELRISKGVARWTANFTPSTSPYSKFK